MDRYVAARAGAVRAVVTATGVDLVSDDGSSASLALLEPSGWTGEDRAEDRAEDGAEHGGEAVTGGASPGSPSSPSSLAAALAAEAARPRTLLVCLVRRGGWSVGVVRDGVVLAGRTGRRYVQGGTAAGGWSQQRFARRRAGQAGKLAEDASSAVAAVLQGHRPVPAAVVGGDRALAEAVLAGTPADGWPRLGPLEVGEPRRADLDAAAERVRALRVTVHDAPG